MTTEPEWSYVTRRVARSWFYAVATWALIPTLEWIDPKIATAHAWMKRRNP